jgi:hypothetical protein
VVLLLGRVDNTVVALVDFRGYPTGLVFKLNLWWRILFDCCQRLPWPVPMGLARIPWREPLTDALLRLGIVRRWPPSHPPGPQSSSPTPSSRTSRC